MKTNFYKVKDLCELTSISVRTLHFYDKIGLLKPSHITSSSHRLYTDKELKRLKKIIALQYMGLKLEQIKSLAGNSHNIKPTLIKQAKVMKQKYVKHNLIAGVIDNLSSQLDLDNPIDWDTMPEIFDVIENEEANTQAWYQNYLTPQELEEDKKIAESRSKTYWTQYTKRWKMMYKKVEKNLHIDPESEIGIELAREWLDLVEEVYPQPSNLRNKLWEAYKAGIIPKDRMPHNPEVIVYITKATKKYKLLKGD